MRRQSIPVLVAAVLGLMTLGARCGSDQNGSPSNPGASGQRDAGPTDTREGGLNADKALPETGRPDNESTNSAVRDADGANDRGSAADTQATP